MRIRQLVDNIWRQVSCAYEEIELQLQTMIDAIWASHSEWKEALAAIAGGGDPKDWLHRAAARGDVTTLSLLSHFTSTINSEWEGKMPIERAAERGHIAAVAVLRALGSDLPRCPGKGEAGLYLEAVGDREFRNFPEEKRNRLERLNDQAELNRAREYSVR